MQTSLDYQCSKLYNIVVGVLSLAPCYVGESRYVELIRLHILVNCMELRWRQPCSDPVAPCKLVKTNKKFYICSDGTHTHTSHVARLDFLEELRWRNRQYTSESEPVKTECTNGRSLQSEEEEFGACRRTSKASWKLMRSTIAHVSLNSPDAVAAFKASERSVANSWIRVVRLGSSAGDVVSMGTL